MGSKPHSKADNFSDSLFKGETILLKIVKIDDKITEQRKKKKTELYSDKSQKIFS